MIFFLFSYKGENIGDAAIREVFEETGVKAEFVSLVAFRHVQNGGFDCADMYFVANLRPLTFEIVIDNEISDAKWMKVILQNNNNNNNCSSGVARKIKK